MDGRTDGRSRPVMWLIGMAFEAKALYKCFIVIVMNIIVMNIIVIMCSDARVGCCGQVSTDAKVRLSGYGVELAIKSTEYKAKDDTVITGK